MIIREMKQEDADQVAKIETQCFSVPWSKQGFLDSIAREDTIFLVAEATEDRNSTNIIRGRILGYIGMYTSFEEGEITNVAVSPEYRKQGIGDQLVTAMQASAKEKNLERIILEVRATNEPALSLYNRKGFVKIGIRKNFYEKPTEDAIIMRCELS